MLQAMAKRLLSRINVSRWSITIVRSSDMVVIDLGYRKVVLPREKAFQLIDCLESAEVYEERYWNDEERNRLGMTEKYTYHVFPLDSVFGMNILSNTKYQLAKLAGKPQEK